MVKQKWGVVLVLGILGYAGQAQAQLTVNGSRAPGTIFVSTINYGQLLPPVTIFFGASPGAPTPTIITHALGNPVNQRGFIWPKDNFKVFGANTGFITTGTGVVQFSSPAPAVDVVALYSITPAAGALVGSVGYAFPDSSPDQAHGTYNVTIGIAATSFGSVGFTLQWTVNPHFKLFITPQSSGTGNFGSVAFGEAPTNQTFIISTETNEGEPYTITLSTAGIINEFGTQLDGFKVYSDGISGNKLKRVSIPVETPTPVRANEEVVLYRSNSEGNSDFFNLGLAAEPPAGQQAGDYSGALLITFATL